MLKLFFLVGHTQVDIDQAFSKTSNCLRRGNEDILTDIHDVFRKVFAAAVDVIHLKQIVKLSGLSKHSKPIKIGPCF